MSWISILKADIPPISVGALMSKFRTGNLPTKEEISKVTNQDLQNKYLDSVLTKLKEQFESSKEGNDIPDSIISQMINGKRTKVASTRDEAFKIIEQRLNDLKELTTETQIASEVGFIEGFNEVEGKKTPFGRTYGDLVSTEGKTNQEWTIETLNVLYDMMVNEPSVEVLYALHKFIDGSTNGQFKSDTKWYNKMGLNSIDNPDPKFFQNIFDLRLEDEVTGGLDTRVFDFFTDKYKYTAEEMQNITVVSGKEDDKYGRASERVRREGTTERSKIIGDARTMTIGEKGSERLPTNDNIANMINDLTENNFKDLVLNLQKTNSAEGIFKNIKNQSIGIVYDMAFKKPGIAQLVRDIQIRRKGDSDSQRKRDFLIDWTISYINRRINEADDTLNIGGYDLFSTQKLNERDDEGELLYPRSSPEYKTHYKNKSELKDWIINKVNEGDETWSKRYKDDIRRKNQMDSQFRKLPAEEQKEILADNQKMKEYFNFQGNTGPDFVDLAYSFNTSKGVSDFIDLLGKPMSRFQKNMLAVMYNSYIDLGVDGQDKINQIIPMGNFRGYLPTGRLFADAQEQTFLKSMRAFFTVFKMSLPRAKLSTLNVTFSALVAEFFDRIDEYFSEIDDTSSVNDRLYIMEEILEGIGLEENANTWFNTKNDFEELESIIDKLREEVEDAIQAKLISNIQTIADDTTNKYPKIREYLIRKKYLKPFVPKNEGEEE
jgi:hypothetical protein|tara:strand:- start:3340 stop:5490 length:2151 start_codon:yes stop_codon:yes gene_type:complete